MHPARQARPPRSPRSGPDASGCTAANPSRARSPTRPWGPGTRARCRAARRRCAAARPPPGRARRPSPRCAGGGARAGGPPAPRPAPAPAAARSRGDRPGLEDEDAAALHRPLDVLRHAEALLEVVAQARELRQQLVGHLLDTAVLLVELLLDHAAVGHGDDRVRLAMDLGLLDGPIALEDVVVRRDVARHHRLAEA